MRVLVLHSRYLSGSMSGENRVVDDEAELLRLAGHDVVTWAPSVAHSDHRFRTASNAIWSRNEAANVRRLIAEQQPDVVHVHSLYPQLSPAVIRAAADLEVPVLMTLHNFRLMCLPATFLRNGQPCESCAGHVPWRGVVHGCYRESRTASAALASSLVLHRRVGTFERVRLYIAVSEFAKHSYIRYGLDADRIRVKPNFSWPLPQREGPGSAFAFIGRLSAEKGVERAISAVGSDAELTIVGDGPEGDLLRRTASPNVSFKGSVEPEAALAHLSGARAVLVPSRCYEGAPRTIIEAFAAGVPVLASRIGGLGELVEDNVNGLLVEPDDARGWRAAVDRLLDDDESVRLGRGAYETWKRRFTPALATAHLEHAYAAACARPSHA